MFSLSDLGSCDESLTVGARDCSFAHEEKTQSVLAEFKVSRLTARYCLYAGEEYAGSNGEFESHTVHHVCLFPLGGELAGCVRVCRYAWYVAVSLMTPLIYSFVAVWVLCVSRLMV